MQHKKNASHSLCTSYVLRHVRFIDKICAVQSIQTEKYVFHIPSIYQSLNTSNLRDIHLQLGMSCRYEFSTQRRQLKEWQEMSRHPSSDERKDD